MIRPVVALALTLAFAGVALADDFKWDPKKKRAPAVGDRQFESESEALSQKLKVSVGGQPQPNQSEKTTTRYQIVREVLAVAEGKATKQKVQVVKWHFVRADDEDKSLEGKTILVEGHGEKATATVEGGDEGLSPGAKQWVKRHFSKKESDENEEKFFPKSPIGNDSEWTIDAKDIANELKEHFGEIDPAKSTAKGKLTKVRVEGGCHFGTIELKLSVQLKTVPNAPIEWSEGGVLEINMVRDMSLEPEKSRKATTRREGRLKGKAEQKTEMGEISIKMDIAMAANGQEGELGSGEKPPEITEAPKVGEKKDGEKKDEKKAAD